MNHQLHLQIQLLHLFGSDDPIRGRDHRVRLVQPLLARLNLDRWLPVVRLYTRRLAQMPDLDLAREAGDLSVMLNERVWTWTHSRAYLALLSHRQWLAGSLYP